MIDDARTLSPGQQVLHPGPVAAERTTHRMGRTQPFSATRVLQEARREMRADGSSPLLEAGTRPLADVMVAAVEAAGADSGIVEFSGVSLPRISYCFPAYGDDDHPMLYSSTHESSGIVLQGTATVGFRRVEGADELSRWIHFHIAWVDSEGGVHGGHLWPETLMDGSLTHATVWPLYGMTLVNAPDEETLLPVFTPHAPNTAQVIAPPAPDASRGDRDALFARVRPNVELVESIENLARVHGLIGGTVRGGTGSLVGGASFADRTLDIGPASEVISLTGELGAPHTEGGSPFACSLVVAGGRVHGGRLHAHGNLVGATYDLMLAGPADS